MSALQLVASMMAFTEHPCNKEAQQTGPKQVKGVVPRGKERSMVSGQGRGEERRKACVGGGGGGGGGGGAGAWRIT